MTTTISIEGTDASRLEGNSGTTPFTYTVTRTGDLSGTTTVYWRVEHIPIGLSADADDFFGHVFPSGTLVFAPGETSKIITVNVTGDSLYETSPNESGESFLVKLIDDSTGVFIAAATGFIENDDVLPSAGSLDPTFGGDGIVTTPIESTYDSAKAVTWTSSNQTIYTVGNSVDTVNVKIDFVVTAYLSDGTPDTSFNGDGTLTFDFGSDDEEAADIAVQDDGRIVIAGWSNNGLNADFALARFNADGSLDATFGNGGKVTTAIGPANDYVNALALQPDGKMVLAGESWNGTDYDFALVRYNTDGGLDTTFGDGGKVTTPIGTSLDDVRAIGFYSDGRIAVAGETFNGSNYDFAVARYNSDGSLDTTFGNGGKVTTAMGSGFDLANDLVVQPDGRIVVAGWSDNGLYPDFALARYLSDGSLDTTFGNGGKVLTAAGTSTDGALSLALQSDGKMVAAGWSSNGSNFDFAVIRYFSDGTLDTTFDGDGKLTVAVGSADDFAWDVFIQDDGNILAAGVGSGDIAVIRVLGQGLSALAISSLNADQPEGDSGTTPFTFTVARSGDVDGTTTVDWAVEVSDTDPSADADDFGGEIQSGTLTFLPTVTNQTITVNVASDTIYEGGGLPEHFTVTLSNASGGASITTATAEGSIQNDDALRALSAGSLDTTFDEDGIVTTAVGIGDDRANAVSWSSSNERIVTVGNAVPVGDNIDFAAVGNFSDGSPATWGDGGSVLISDFGSDDEQALDLEIQPDGKIICAGVSDDEFSSHGLIVRWLADGSLDTTFGNGGTVSTAPRLGVLDLGISVALGPEGSIAVAESWSIGSVADVAITLFSADGTLTTTFDNIDFGSDVGQSLDLAAQPDGSNPAFVLAVQPDGRIVVAGRSYNGSDWDFALARCNTDGSLDTSFDGDGKLTTAIGTSDDYAYGLALQPDGKILVAGTSHNGSNYDVALARYLSDGSLDTTFDGDGKVITAIGTSDDHAYGLALQPDGKILVAGTSYNGSNLDFALVRYTSDGSLDTTFDGDGRLTVAIGSGDEEAFGLALQPDGRILAAGYSFNGTNDDFALIRVLGSSVSSNLVAGPGDDTLEGGSGDDTLTGAAGNDTVNGSEGADLAVFSANRSAYTLTGSAPNFSVSGPDGNDSLSSIERLQFADKKLAFDLGLTENAGHTARLLGAVFGASFVHNPAFVGIGLGLFTTMTYTEVAQLALDFVLGSDPTNEAVVQLLYTNIIGTAPDAGTTAYFAGFITSGAYTQATLTTFAADTDFNADHIGLAGLQQTGLEFA